MSWGRSEPAGAHPRLDSHNRAVSDAGAAATAPRAPLSLSPWCHVRLCRKPQSQAGLRAVNGGYGGLALTVQTSHNTHEPIPRGRGLRLLSSLLATSLRPSCNDQPSVLLGRRSPSLLLRWSRHCCCWLWEMGKLRQGRASWRAREQCHIVTDCFGGSMCQETFPWPLD